MLRLRNNKTISSIFILLGITFLFVIILLLPGCRDTSREEGDKTKIETSEEHQAFLNTFKEVLSPASLPYLISNSLEYKNHVINEGFLISFKGLLDKEIEKNVNLDIQKRFERLRNTSIPPYRGIMTVVKEPTPINPVGTEAWHLFSAYNLLSIQISESREYPHKDSTNIPLSTTITDSYNVDLNTGRELWLRDLFTDDVDYKALINDFILKDINRISSLDGYDLGDSDPTLVSPFTGIKESQKFLLTSNELLIILDYETPEFDTNFNYYMVRIPYHDLAGFLAIKERFYNDQPNLYENPEPSKQLISVFPTHVKGEAINLVEGNLLLHVASTYPENTPEIWESLFLEAIQSKDKKVEDIIKTYSDQEEDTYYTLEYYGQIVGPYFNISEVSMISQEADPTFLVKVTTYDEEGNMVNFQDLFAPGFSYNAILDDYLKQTIQIEMEINSSDVDFEELKSSLSFSINSESFSFSSKPIELEEGIYHSLEFYIEFEEFGFDNLIFFNDES